MSWALPAGEIPAPARGAALPEIEPLAGVMQNGVVVCAEEGTPQGGPFLANVYPHFVLDLWFEKKKQSWCQGEVCLTRFADDFWGRLQYKRDVEGFDQYLQKRFARFKLELSNEKTRPIFFKRFAAEMNAEHSARPKAFEFLGFMHVCGTNATERLR
jgi:RNA-directed DNA polymerase